MVTDDIDVSWRTRLHGYEIMYEPRALCWVLMPKTVRDLYRQRLHWTQDGAEVIPKHSREAWHLKNIRLQSLYFKHVVTLTWICLLFAFFFVGIAQAIGGTVDLALLKLDGLAISIALLIQLPVGIYVDSCYEDKLLRYFVSCTQYPYAFRMINSLTLVRDFPKALLRDENRRVTQTSPGRGVQ